MSDRDDDNMWKPVEYWPDPLTAVIVNARPGSQLANEFISLAMRARLDVPDRYFLAADVGGVMAEQGAGYAEIAANLHVPPAYMYAVMRGWHRLGVRGLALVAEALEVPISSFFVDADERSRLEVRRFHAFKSIAANVTILGGDNS